MGAIKNNKIMLKHGIFSYFDDRLRRNLICPNFWGSRGLNGGVAYAFGRYLNQIGVTHIKELGCGVGTTSLALRLCGVSVVGYDCN